MSFFLTVVCITTEFQPVIFAFGNSQLHLLRKNDDLIECLFVFPYVKTGPLGSYNEQESCHPPSSTVEEQVCGYFSLITPIKKFNIVIICKVLLIVLRNYL